MSPSHLVGLGSDLGNYGAGEAGKFGKLWCRKSVFKPVYVKISGLKLNFESQIDILYAIFCFNFSLYRYCSWQTK